MNTGSFYRLIIVVIIIIFAVLTISLYLPSGLKTAPRGSAAPSIFNNTNYTLSKLPVGLLSAIPNSSLNTIILPNGIAFQPEVSYGYLQGATQTNLTYTENVTAMVNLNTICDADPGLLQCKGVNDTLDNLLSYDRGINISMIFNQDRIEINSLYQFVQKNNLSNDTMYAPIIQDSNLININTTNTSAMLHILVNLRQVAGVILNKSDYLSDFGGNVQNLSNISIVQLINFIPPFELPFYVSPFIQNYTGTADLVSNQSEFNNAVYKSIISFLGRDVSTVCLITAENACSVNEMKALNSSEYAKI